MAASRHHRNVRDYLNSNAGLSQTIHAGSFVQESPDDAIAVRATGGPPPQYMMRSDGVTIKDPTVQILVRGTSDEPKAVEDRANTVYDTLVDADISGYDATFMEQSGPLELGADGQGRFLWSINVRLMIEE